MKKFFVVMVAAILVSLALPLSACTTESEKINEVHVSTLAELQSVGNGSTKSGFMKLTKTINVAVLDNDIDGAYQTVSCISVDRIDGNGYTISNLYVYATSSSDKTSLIDAEQVTNINFKNINISGSATYSAGIIYSECELIQNVTAENCTVTAMQALSSNYTRALYAGCLLGGGDSGDAYLNCQIIDCSVEDSSVVIEKYSGSGNNYRNIYAGGIAGASNYIEGCSVINCTVTATSSYTSNDAYVGGIVGYSEGSITKSYVKDSSLTATASNYTIGTWGLSVTTSTAYIGGIVAHIESSEEITYCYAEDNDINGICSGELYIGGIGAYVYGTSLSQSYAAGNDIDLSGYYSDEKNYSTRVAGGLIGIGYKDTVTSCFAYGNSITDNSTVTNSSYSKVGGLIGSANTTIVNYSAAGNNTCNAATTDLFCPTEITSVTYCYITDTDTGNNSNDCSTIESSVWFSGLNTYLLLTGSNWVNTSGQLPQLVFE